MSDELDLSFLYYFSAASQDLLEVRINGLQEGTSPALVYHWLHHDQETQQLHKLTFQSMGSDHGQDLRVFAEAELRFNASQAQLRWTNSVAEEKQVLDALSVQQIPSVLTARAQNFLRSLRT
jgi:hypothetical protein